MILLRGVAFIFGFFLVAEAWLSAIKTFVLPRSARDPLTSFVFISMRRLFDIRLRRTKTYAQRDRILAFYAPFSLLALLPTWLFVITIGYTGMYWALGVKDLFTAFRISGSSLLTLGFASQGSLPLTILDFTEATLGLMMIALLIAYLPSMYSAFSRREAAVALLEVRAGKPPSAEEMIIRFHRIHGLDKLGDQWQTWENWFTEVEESHTSLAALVFFRSPQADRSWVTAAGTVLDAAALARSSLDLPPEPRADLCIRAGYLCLRHVADFFSIPYHPDPHFPDQPISVSRQEYDNAIAGLESAGVPLKGDREQAWRDFAGWRVNYNQVLIALADLTMAPDSPWIGSRPISGSTPPTDSGAAYAQPAVDLIHDGDEGSQIGKKSGAYRLMTILGLHHITLVCSDAQRTVDFYTGVLGLRLVKKTVNFDDPGSYHLYFGDEAGSPGSAVTFFEWPHAPQGRPGIGGTHHFALLVEDYTGLLQWKRRLTDLGLAVDGPLDRVYFKSIYFRDPDGTILEIATRGPGWTVDEPPDQIGTAFRQPPGALIISNRDAERIAAEIWPEPLPEITPSMQLTHGMHHITAIGADIQRTHAFFGELLGMKRVKMTNNFDDPDSAHWYWGVEGGRPGTLITYFERQPGREARVRMGSGQTHHFALAVADEEAQLAWREKLLGAGLRVTPVLDRIYFKSIYTNDPDGHIVELATAGPGFTVDEEASQLGSTLKLPPWLERHRSDIEGVLKPVSAPEWQLQT